MNPKAIKFIKFWLPVAAWAGIIFAFSANPTTGIGDILWQDFIIKKSAHIFVFAVLTFFIYRAFINYNLTQNMSVKYSFILSFLYSLSDEFHQSFTPGREPRVRDIAIDSVGIILALYLIIYYLPKAPKIIKLWVERFELKAK